MRTLRREVRAEEEEILQEILPEAFALVREASRRTTGMRHFDVQLIGGMVLHKGRIAEMKTGEGKTLVATLPLYLNALTGRGAHLVTPNDYLSKLGVQWMGPIYHLLGLQTAVIQSTAGDPNRGSYLFDPDYRSADDRFQYLRPDHAPRGLPGRHHLRHQQRVWLRLSARQHGAGPRPTLAARAVLRHRRRGGQHPDRRGAHAADHLRRRRRSPATGTAVSPRWCRGCGPRAARKRPTATTWSTRRTRLVTLTESGIEQIQDWLGISNLYSPEHFELSPYLDNALRAAVLYQRDRDYIVRDDEVIIVDEFTGRLMEGRRYSEGLHQAIEAKEGVKVQRESLTLATITFQNYFRMYAKLAGMTGTAETEKEEFAKIYELDVVAIPTTRTGRPRRSSRLRVSHTGGPSSTSVIDEIDDCYKREQPVLVGTVAIETSEYLSALLQAARRSAQRAQRQEPRA